MGEFHMIPLKINNYNEMKHIFKIYLLILILLPFSLIAQNPINKIFNAEQGTQEKDTVSIDSNKTNIVINIKDINNLIQDTESLLLKSNKIETKYNWTGIDSIFSEKERFIDKEAKDFYSYDQDNLSKFFLQNLKLSWKNYVNEIEKWQSDLNNHLTKTIENSDKFTARRNLIKEYYNLILNNDIPALDERMTKTISDLDSVINIFDKQKQQLLILQTRLSNKNILCNKIIEEIDILNAQLRVKVFAKTKPAIWHIKLKNTIRDGLSSSFKRAYENNYRSIIYYYSNLNNRSINYVLLMVLIVSILLIIRKKYIGLGYDSSTPGYVKIERVLIKHPKAIIFSLAVIFWIFFFPFTPTLLADIFFIGILISLSIILRSFIDKTGGKLLTTLAIILVLNVLEVIIWYLGNYSRLYLFFETFVALLLLFPFLSIYKNNKFSEKSRFVRLAKRFLPFMLFTYLAAFIGNIFGFENFTVLFIKIGIRTAAITMVAFGYVRILETIYMASVNLLNAKYSDIAFKYGAVIEKRGSKIIHITVFIIWAKLIFRIFEINTVVNDWISMIFTTDLTVGTISFSLADILLFGVILYVTYLITTFVKTIIEGEILRKMKLPRGFPAAISMIFRIFLVTLGILFALSATGIELSKLSLLAGALGVGIGFGLQNIVQNFISGLILIFERPIQVGDTVEVNNLLGKVKEIGVRASNVITYDGAEVVVPNSNLISNDLINWTLSDNKKRIEIKVGVAYGTDPNLVLKLIERVALDHPDVEKNTPPRALFEGFGDSSLDFRLLFWVNFELGLGTRSDVAVGIYNTFAEHNIEIPFPQVDLHVKNNSTEIIAEENLSVKSPKSKE